MSSPIISYLINKEYKGIENMFRTVDSKTLLVREIIESGYRADLMEAIEHFSHGPKMSIEQVLNNTNYQKKCVRKIDEKQ